MNMLYLPSLLKYHNYCSVAHPFCRASFRVQVESFWGTIPWSSTINLLLPSISVFVSVYCHRPRAQQPTLCRGGLKPATTKLVPNVGPMAGDRGIAIAARRESASHRPTAKSYRKWFLSMRKQQQPYDFATMADRLIPAVHHTITRHKKMNLQCAVPSWSTVKVCWVLRGSAQLTSGERWWHHWSPGSGWRRWTLTVWETLLPCPSSQHTSWKKVQQWQKNKQLHSELLWCLGHRTCRCLKHRNCIVQDATGTFYECLGHFRAKKHHRNQCLDPTGQIVLFLPFFMLLPHSKSELGYRFLWFNFMYYLSVIKPSSFYLLIIDLNPLVSFYHFNCTYYLK